MQVEEGTGGIRRMGPIICLFVFCLGIQSTYRIRFLLLLFFGAFGFTGPVYIFLNKNW